MTPVVLCIGGMDSSGGAGLLRDAASVAAAGARTRVAVTAVTAQSDARVRAVSPVAPELVVAQIASALESRVDAVKLGMLVDAPTVAAVAGVLPQVPLVLDPVLASSSGRVLLDPPGVAALIEALLPRTEVLTPNLPELSAFGACFGISGEPEIVRALQGTGCRWVLVKGGHADGQGCEDRLYCPDGAIERIHGPRHPRTLRGTGCQLASAIAAGRALGHAVPEAVRRARRLLEARFIAEGRRDEA
ncbi:MAG: hydroxymethylpyrimidine/phosphomethylpyrimidine kinase [Rhodobacteraceae bacterium]|nr:hydroxymethylpyrimidine/phosphomethylpyrimidine kinase [Paracoccaceae bacterium]